MLVGKGVLVGVDVGQVVEVAVGIIVAFLTTGSGNVGIGVLVGVQVAVGSGMGVFPDELPPQPTRVMITRNNRSSKSRRLRRSRFLLRLLARVCQPFQTTIPPKVSQIPLLGSKYLPFLNINPVLKS